MAYRIDQEICLQCGSCAPFCMNQAIEWVEHHYLIITERCDQCGTCREYCPVDDAIVEHLMSGGNAMQPASNRN